MLRTRPTQIASAFLLACAWILTACQGQFPADFPVPSTPVMKVAPEVCTAAFASPARENLPAPNSGSKAILGGGVLESESIGLVAWVYCDAKLSPAGSGPDYSAIEGLGIHMAWNYTGETLPGPVEYFIGPIMAPSAATGMSGDLTRGSSAAFTGGIDEANGALEEAIATGTDFTYQVQVKTGDEILATGNLTFSILQTDTGLQPASIFFKAVTYAPPTSLPKNPSPAAGNDAAHENDYCNQLTQQYQSPPGFQTYCDPQYNFAFDYPADWQITSVVDNPARTAAMPPRIVRGQIFAAPDMSNLIRVYTYFLPGTLSLADFHQEATGYAEREFIDKNYPDLKLGGQQAYAVLNRWHQDYSGVNLFFQHGPYVTVMELKAITLTRLETNWQIARSLQVPGTTPAQNLIPEELIVDSKSLLP